MIIAGLIRPDYNGFLHIQVGNVKVNVKYGWFIILSLIVLSQISKMALADSLDIAVSQEIEVNIQRVAAKGESLLLWLPSESGLLDQEKKQADKLKLANIETWFADMLGTYFLPALASSIDSIKSSDTAELIEKVRQKSKKQIVLIGSGRGAALVIRAARSWQIKYGQKEKLAGVILISPKLFVETPEPGQEGKLLSVVYKTNLPVVIIQPENSPWRWKMGNIIPALEKSGSDVYAWFINNTRDRFYYRPDATKQEDAVARKLDFYITSAVHLLKSYQFKTRSVGKLEITETKQPVEGKKERVLRAYTGDPRSPELILKDLQGRTKDLAAMKDKVVLVNYWASWCPPCVHEMPSMQQLANKFSGQSFEILAVNMAEDKQTIQTFLKEKVQVKFPILLDSDGKALKRWKVFAFPTSYIIGKQGNIRLALFGSIDWMKPDVIKKIKILIDE